MLRPVSPGFASSRQASHLPPSLISVCPGSSVPPHRHPRRPLPQTTPFPSDSVNAADETTRNPAIFRLAPSTTSMIPSAPSQPVARLDEPTRNPTTFRPDPSTSPTKPPATRPLSDPLHQPARRANPQARPASPHPRFHPPTPLPYNSKKRRTRICATAAMPLIADRRRGGPAPPDPPRAP